LCVTSRFRDEAGAIAQTFDSRDSCGRAYMDVFTACLRGGVGFIFMHELIDS